MLGSGNVNKKKLIIIICGCLVAIVCAIVAVIAFTGQDKEMEEVIIDTGITHEMLIEINPSVRITYKGELSLCENDNGTYSACGGKTEIIGYELVNDDAKDIYKDIDFNGMEVMDVILTLCDKARDAGIAFDKLSITTDDNIDRDDKAIVSYIKENSSYEYDIHVDIDITEYVKKETEEETTEVVTTEKQEEKTTTEKTTKEKTTTTKNDKTTTVKSTSGTQTTKVVSDPTTSTTTVKATTTSTKTTTTTTTKVVIDKVNLNDNVVVEEGVFISCGYVFAANKSELEGLGLIEYSSINFDKEDEFYNKIQYDSALENKMISVFNKYKGKTFAGMEGTFSYTFENHEFSYFRNILYFEDSKYNSITEKLYSMREDITKARNNSIMLGGCGASPEPAILNEELCKKYNIPCYRG